MHGFPAICLAHRFFSALENKMSEKRYLSESWLAAVSSAHRATSVTIGDGAGKKKVLRRISRDWGFDV